MHRIVTVVLLASLHSAAYAPAAVVKTKDGRQIEGRVVSTDADDVVIETVVASIATRLMIPRQEVISIDGKPLSGNLPAFLSAATKAVPDAPRRYLVGTATGKFGFVDDEGKLVIAADYDAVLPFSESRAAVLIGNRIGFINPTGKMVVNPKFDYRTLREGLTTLLMCTFSEGLSVVPIDGKFGYIDPDGAVVLKPKFDFATPFKEGLAYAASGPETGYINKRGNWIIKTHGNAGSAFSEGLAAVSSGGKWGYVDRRGQSRVEPQFDSASAFSEGLAVVSVGGKFGFIDPKGAFVINPKIPVRLVV